MRAALYIRLSEETDTTTSPERQRDAARKYAESRGWNVVDTFEDIDVSATHRRLERPSLDRLRSEVAASKIDVVVVYRLDRLARNVYDSLTLLEEWRRLGTAIVSTTEGIDATTPAGKAMFTLVAVFAEMEAAAISARVTSSIDRLRTEGRFAGGTVPYGYTTAPLEIGFGRRLVVVPAEAEIIKEAASRVLAGEAPYRVCRDLNERKVPSPRSEYRRIARMTEEERYSADVTVEGADPGTWRVQSLKRLLTGDHLVGRQTHQGGPLLDSSGLPKEVWTPIITTATLAALRERLAAQESRPRTVRAARLLSGLVFCAVCGSKMYVRVSGGRPLYGCPARSRGETCPGPRVQAEALEMYVVGQAIERLGDVAMTETVLVTDTPAIGVEYQETERAIRATGEAMTKPGADFAALGARMASLHAHREELAARGAEVSAMSVSRPTGRSWADDWTALDDEDDRRRFLAEWVPAVRISPATKQVPYLDVDRVEVTFVDLE